MTKHEDLICVYAGRNKGLRDLLDAWTRVVLRYCELHQFKDNPWWANERASVSSLAAAAWTLDGWCALEEFGMKKRGVIPRDEGEGDGLKNGRCDLYVGNKTTSFVLEAKQAWQPIGPKADGGRRLNEGMKNAWHDVGKVSADEAHRRYAATFVIPHVPKTHIGSNGAGTRELVQAWLESNIQPKGKRPISYAYVFPGRFKDFVGNVSGRAFPGVVLILEERMRANKSTKN